MQNLAQCVRFPIFRKGKAFLLNYLSELPFSIALWTICSRSIFRWCTQKSFEIFKTLLEKNPCGGSCCLVFCKIGVLKIFANFARKHPCWSHFVVKPPEVKRLQDRCFPMNFTKLLRTTFFT